MRLWMAIVVATTVLVGCGAEDEPAAESTPGPTASETGESSPVSTVSPFASATTLDGAVQAAEQEGFPLLAPTRVPAGWRVMSAEYGVEGRGTWTLSLTDHEGGQVEIRQALPDVPAAYVADIGSALGSGARPVGTLDLGPLGVWDRYYGPRYGTTLVAGRVRGTKVVMLSDHAASLRQLGRLLGG